MPVYRTTYALNDIAAIREADHNYHLKGEYFYYEDDDAVQYAILVAENEKEAYAKSLLILGEQAEKKRSGSQSDTEPEYRPEYQPLPQD
jgi:hypothetical protein